jgi:hypothetical protein
MAIIDCVKGLEVCILVQGQPLPEYEDDEEVVVAEDGSDAARYRASRTVTRYIESKEGENEIRIGLDQNFNFDYPTLSAFIKIDGKKALHYVWPKGNHFGASQWVTRGAPVGKVSSAMWDLVKPFTFSKIELSRLQSVGFLNLRTNEGFQPQTIARSRTRRETQSI